ncbi:MAG: TIGR02206 family membrane protein [Akkermansia sp.]|nr:TIGR02206 family membrane protein [Akkermansia sp.]
MTDSTFTMWSTSHLIAIGVIAVISTLVVLCGRRLSPQNQVYFARIFGAFMLLFYVYEYAWRFTTHGITACIEHELLPLHFCAFMSLICIIALWWRSSWACALVYFGVLSASIQAIFTPVLKEDFPSTAFFNFFISHSLLLMAALIQVGVLGWRARRRDPLLAVILMDIYVMAIHPVNLWLGSNYGFTTHGPAGTILAQLGPGPWYYLWLQLPALALFYLMYIFVRRKN